MAQFAFSFLLLTTLVVCVNCWEVYLRELTVFKSHESALVDDNPEPYISCDDDRPRVNLYGVHDVNKTYTFDSEEIPVTHLHKDECVVCTLKEADFFDADDTFGAMKLCSANFGPSGRSEVTVPGEFHAVFDCEECKTTSTIGPDQDKQLELMKEGLKNKIVQEALESKEKQSPNTKTMVLLCLGCFLGGALVGGVVFKFYRNYQDRKEELRRREMNYMLSNSEVPFEELSRHGRNSSGDQPGPANYHPVSVLAG